MMSVQLVMGEKNNQKKGKEECVQIEAQLNQPSTIIFLGFFGFFSWQSLEKNIFAFSRKQKDKEIL